MPVRLTILLLAAYALTPAGELTARFDLTLKRVLQGGPPHYTEPFLLADVIPENTRRFTNFSGDLSGRYLGALAMSRRRRDAAGAPLESLVSAILRRQKSDGHFGDPMGRLAIEDDDMARLWGNGRLLIGLLEYHRETPRPDVLRAARALGDFLIDAAPRFSAAAVEHAYSQGKFAVGYVCWTQNIEGLVALSRETKDRRYLDLAAQMAGRTRRHPSQHSHGFLTSLRGILDLHLATGEQRYLDRVEREWQSLRDSENWLIQGAIPEAFAPGIDRTEGCSEADWLRLSLALWRLTGNSEYLEQAERTLFNEFFANQFASGDFGHYKIAPTGIGFGGARAWWCCTLHGLRALADVYGTVFRTGEGRLYFDLPADGEGQASELAVRANSTLETDGSILLEVVSAPASEAEIAVRVPAWSDGIAIDLGDSRIDSAVNDGYRVVRRIWKAGERVTVRYKPKPRLERDPRHPKQVAVFNGPWLLAVSETDSPYFYDEPYEHNRVNAAPLLESSAEAIAAARPDDAASTKFRAPFAYRELEWTPAGYRGQRLKTQVRPISERTAEAALGRWDFWFREGDAADAAGPLSNQSRRTPWLLGGGSAIVIILLAAGWARRRRLKRT